MSLAKERKTEVASDTESLPAPGYNPGLRSEENLDRIIHLAKFVTIGAGVGFFIGGLLLGAPLALKVAELHPLSAGAVAVSNTVAGMVLGALAGGYLEQWTWSGSRQ